MGKPPRQLSVLFLHHLLEAEKSLRAHSALLLYLPLCVYVSWKLFILVFVAPRFRRLHCPSDKSHINLFGVCLSFNFWLYSKDHHVASHFEQLCLFVFIFFYKEEKLSLLFKYSTGVNTSIEELNLGAQIWNSGAPCAHVSTAQGEDCRGVSFYLFSVTYRSSFPYCSFPSLHVLLLQSFFAAWPAVAS